MDDDDAFAAGVAFVLEELGEREDRLRFDDVGEWEQLAEDARLLSGSVVGRSSSTGSSESRSTPTLSQQASKSPGSSLAVTKLPFNQICRHPASASNSIACASQSRRRRRRWVHPNRSTTSSHDATCSPGGSLPLSGWKAGSTPQHYHCVVLDPTRTGDKSAEMEDDCAIEVMGDPTAVAETNQ